jgi:hypothetical protein
MSEYKLVPIDNNMVRANVMCKIDSSASNMHVIDATIDEIKNMLASCPDVSSEPDCIVSIIDDNKSTSDLISKEFPTGTHLYTKPQLDKVAHLESMIITRDSNIQWLKENYERVGGENVELNGVITQLEAKLKVAREALEFYAKVKHIEHPENFEYSDFKKENENWIEFEHYNSHTSSFCENGEVATEALKKIGGTE